MRFQPEDEIGLARPTGLAFAPDGSTVVVTVEEADLLRNQRSSRLWHVTAAETRPLTVAGGSQRFPLWSPDGRQIAFVANGTGSGDLLLVAAAGGGRAEVVLGAERGFVAGDIFSARSGLPGFAWAPDSRRLAVQLRSGQPVPGELGVEGPRATGDPLVATEITERLRGGPAVRLVTVDVDSGAVVELAESARPFSSIACAPDGETVYAVERQEGATGGESVFRYLRCAPGRQPEVLIEFSGAAFAAVPAPDGSRIAASLARGTTHAAAPGLALYDGAGRLVRELAPDDRASYSDLAWLSPRTLVAIADAGTRRRLTRIDVESGEQATIGGIAGWPERLAVSGDGAALAVIASAPDEPGQVYRLPATGGDAEQMTRLNPQLGQYELGQGTSISWQAADGSEIEGVLITPLGQSGPAPLVLEYHGGPAAHVGLGWNGLRQVLAAAGYAVLAPNFRGSTGYGQAFGEALRGDLGGAPFTDSLAGVDHLIEQRIADPERLVTYGHSWGGYMTNWTIGHSDRCRAAISSGSVADLVSAYYTRYSSDVWRWRCKGTPLETLDVYRRWSPIFSAGHVTTPTLFLNGGEDRTTPPTQGLEMFTALRQQNVPAEYVVYPREGHGISEPAHQLDRMNRILGWFARYDQPGQ